MSGPSSEVEVARLLALATRLMPNRHALAKLAGVMAGTDADTLAAGVTQVQLAQQAGISDRSVRTALRQLEALGAIERRQQPRRVWGYVVHADRMDVVLEALR